jgi:hypothetical protein
MNSDNKTTDLDIIRKRPKLFTWGKILGFYDIEEYTIAKYQEIYNGEKRDILYHIWICGKDTSQSSQTLEGALIYAFSRKFDGLNSQAGYYFQKMIGLIK